MSWEGPGFVDHHLHLLRVAAGDLPPYDVTDPESIGAFHRQVAGRWSTPMDEARALGPVDVLPRLLDRGLHEAASLGLVEVTEAGITDWAYLEALRELRWNGPLPVRVRLLVASGIAEARRMKTAAMGDPWLEVIGVKFYADGWLGPRTCAVCQPFADRPDDTGVLFLDASTLAHRIDPFAERGWTIATHAIGDRAIDAVLDAYQQVYGDDCAVAAPRVEHAQLLRPDLIDRMAGMGVVACIQPSFAVSDAATARAALGEDRLDTAYRWDLLLDAGVRVISGSDYPIESLSPLAGLQRLVTGLDLDARPDAAPVAATVPLDTALPLMTDPAAGVTVLSDDPAAVEPHQIHRIEVEETRPDAPAGRN